jgi:cytochrome c oxidase cbb3-type subunit I/II
MEDPRSTTPQSIMPKYPWLLVNDVDFESIQDRVDAMAMLGVPYADALHGAEQMARRQAREVGAEIAAQGGPDGLEHKQIVALIAYMQRLGTDIQQETRDETGGELRAGSDSQSDTTLTNVTGGAR